MTHYTRRCKHCGITYGWQGSGEGCFSPINDRWYCPECKEAIIKALEKIPRKIEHRFVACEDFTFEEVKELKGLDDERKEERRKAGELVIERVFAGLFDLENENNYYIQFHFFKNDKEYLGSWWTERGEFGLRYNAEWDLKNNKVVGPWRDIKDDIC